jgi:hypothetical protein
MTLVQDDDSGWAPLTATGQIPGGMPPGSTKEVFITPDGKPVTSQFDLGGGDHHRKLFIEYERSFGRGEAFLATHPGPGGARLVPNDWPQRKKDIFNGYMPLAEKAARMMRHGTEEDVAIFIAELRAYRQKFPEIYEDAQSAKRPKTFRIKSVEPPARDR